MKNAKRDRQRQTTFRSESLEQRMLLAADIIMFNDLVAGTDTAANVTTYATNDVASGNLIDVASGDTTGITLTTSQNGVGFATYGADPARGTDAYDVFNGFVDFGAGSGSSLELDGLDRYTYEFSGLNSGNLYEFVGTAIRGNPAYANRWTLVTIDGADSFRAAHSEGNGIVTDGLDANQVAVWTGANSLIGQGFIAQWVDIDPGSDGEFSVVSTQYTGPTPGVGTGTASGSKGYGITGIRFIEHDSSLRVRSSTPANGELVLTAPSGFVTEFSRGIDVRTLQASDLMINGEAAASVTPIGNTAAEWTLPQLRGGTQTVAISAGAIGGAAGGDPIEAFASSFTIAAAPVVENVSPSSILATAATIGGSITDTGGIAPAAVLYWGTIDGGTDADSWQNTVNLGIVELGEFTVELDGLADNTSYFYRAFASHAVGSAWATSSASFTTTALSVPALDLNPASGIGAFSATVSGSITDTGGEPPEVQIYYGETDGETDAADWDNVLVVGERLDTFAAVLPGLTAQTQYFFRATAENSGGLSWSPMTRSLTTTDTPMLVINEFMAANVNTLSTRIRTATNSEFRGPTEFPDWIELRNLTAEPIDLGGMHLTDDPGDPNQWQFPAGTTIPASGYLVVYASAEDITNAALDETGRLHTNFSLSASGEYVAITGTDGSVIDEYANVPSQVQDVSYGLIQNDKSYLATPTPDEANADTFTQFVEDTRFTVDRGFYTAPFEVEITSATANATIRYTLDGTPPSTSQGTVYSGPIMIEGTSTLRAIAYQPGMQPTNVDTQTYIFVDDVIRQTSTTTIASGFPSNWGGESPDYGMDSDVIGPNDDFGGRYADTIRDDLKALPTLSIVTDIDGIFGAGGIYSNPTNSSLEVPTSVEFFTDDGSEEFQINAGIKIQGGAFRSFGLTRKKSFRLKFKSEYGPSKLHYPLFGDEATQEFDTLTLRMEANDGWQWSGANGQPQYARDEFGRRTQLASGQPGSHGRYTHVYINGVYWGVFNMVERPDQSFAEAYFGVDKEDWDGINSGTAINADDAARANRATSAWNTLVSLSSAVRSAETEAERTAALMRAQGLHPDGTNDPTQASYVDIENMIDYFIVNWYADNSDWPQKNYYVGRENSMDSEGFKFFMWDAEWSLLLRSSVTGNRISDARGVAAPIQNFRFSKEFRLQFADRVQQLLVNPGGALYVNPDNPSYDPARPEDNVPAARYAAITEEVFDGLVAESARWGDQHRGTPYTRDNEWQTEYDRLMNGWFPQRTENFLNNLRGAELYPNVFAPVFHINGETQHGGQVSSGDSLSLTAAASIVRTTTTLLDVDAPVRAFVPSDDSLESGPGPRWYDVDFDDSEWTTGANGVGYDTGSDYDDLINIDLGTVASSLYTRYEFTLSDNFDVTTVDELLLRMRYDDGFVAYLNGQLVASKNAPSPAVWNSHATSTRLDLLNTIFSEPSDITNLGNLLQPGRNVLAIHTLNHANDQGDLLSRAEMELTDAVELSAPIFYTLDGRDPRELGGGVVGVSYDGTIPITQTMEVSARAFVGGQWSALNRATFVINPATSGDLVISEINYNPSFPTSAELAVDGQLDNDDFEFVEIMNRSDQDVELFGLHFENGVDFEFPASTLPAGQRAVIVKDITAFRLRYGATIAILGEFADGSLANGGERLHIVDGSHSTIVDVTYDDNDLWPRAADGFAATLQLIDPLGVSTELFSEHYSWQSSTEWNGTPGTAGADRTGIVISEVLAHTNPPLTSSDAIELHNTTHQAIDIGGWYLSDSGSNLLKYQIPAGTMLGPNAYVVFDESDFNPTPLTPRPADFALSGAEGDDVWLVEPTESTLRFIDDVHFGATFNGQTLGVTTDSHGRLVPLTRNGLGCGNGQALVSDAYIELINYLPSEPTAAALAIDPTLDNNDLEYVVVRGPVSEGWRLRGGIDFEFPVEFSASPTVWILSFDPNNPSNVDKLAAFKTHYEIEDSPLLIGGYSGSLSNGGEHLRLQSPDTSTVDDPTVTPFITVDEVVYDDRGDWPRPVAGDPIRRQFSTYFGSDGGSWVHASQWNVDDQTLGDFDGDNQVDVTDLDLLIDAVRRGSENQDYVLNGDFPGPRQATVDDFVERILGTFYGDLNIDGIVDAVDLNGVGVNWQRHVCGGWQDGDFNGDGFVGVIDLNHVSVNWQQSAVAAARVPRAPLGTPMTAVTVEPDSVAEQSSRENYFSRYDAPDRSVSSSSPSRYHHLESVSRRRVRSRTLKQQVSSGASDRVFADLLDSEDSMTRP